MSEEFTACLQKLQTAAEKENAKRWNTTLAPTASLLKVTVRSVDLILAPLSLAD